MFPAPTLPQELGWPVISRGESALILAPTGTGKTLTAFLWCIDRLMFSPPPPPAERCRVLYISPIKALAVDVERNLRAPLAGVAQMARKQNVEFHEPSISIRTGDTPAAERSRFSRRPADILITTPESIYSDVDFECARDATFRRDGHSRRDPRSRSQQARVSSGAVTRTPRTSLRPQAAEDRTLGDATPAGRGRSLSWAEPKQTSMSERGFRSARLRSDHRRRARVPPSQYRPVTIVDASAPKKLNLCVEVPLDDMRSARRNRAHPERSGFAGSRRGRRFGARFIPSCSNSSGRILLR